jgi:hypothetical protein
MEAVSKGIVPDALGNYFVHEKFLLVSLLSGFGVTSSV